MEIKEIDGFPRYFITTEGKVFSENNGARKQLKVKTREDGYSSVCLYADTKPRHVMVHRLVAIAFIPNVDDKPCVNHMNGLKWDNSVGNLEWVTHAENTRHAFDTGLHNGIGVNSSFCLSTEDQIHHCCRLLEKGNLSIDEIADQVGVGRDVVAKLKAKKSWLHVSSQYALLEPRNVSGPLDEKRVMLVCEKLNSGKKALHIARELGIDRNVVNRIKYKKSYKDISKKYLHTSPTTIESTSSDGSE